MSDTDKIISMLSEQRDMLEKQQKTLDMLVMAQQATNERVDNIEKIQSKMERNLSGVNRSVLDMDERLQKTEDSTSAMSDSINKHDQRHADLYALAVSVDTKIGEIYETLEEINENAEVTRYATNKLLDWAERIEKSAAINSSIYIPPLNLVE